jgi:hypothetical protein
MTATFSASAFAQTPPQQPDPAAMSRQQLRDEVTRLRGIVQGRAVLPQRPAGCTSAENRQFDFWLGEWDVSPTGSTSGVTIAESSITSQDQGCVILEEWRPFGGAHGHSLNIYDASDQRWRQTWADATGRRTEYAGVLDGEGVLRFDNLSNTGPGAQPGGRARMNFQRIDADTVRQWGERFDAETNAWVVTWDLTYKRRS